ncbi:MAG: HEAT repeat domain-containing protein [Planctomycetota bacterium]|nr:HEAT repeat domain-containing protein [Planctomycetota bacterium]
MRWPLLSFSTVLLSLVLVSTPSDAQTPPDKTKTGGKKKLLEKPIGLALRAPAKLAEVIENAYQSDANNPNLDKPGETDVVIAKRDLWRWGAKSGKALSRLLASPSPDVRDCALEILQKLRGSPEAEDNLIALFQSEKGAGLNFRNHNTQRRQAARVLGLMNSSKALTTLLQALNDKSWLRIREGARLALGLYNAEISDDLIAHYQDAEKKQLDGVMVRVLLVLGQVGGDKAEKILVEALEYENENYGINIRNHAAIGLGSLRKKSSVDALVNRLGRERDHYVQKYITRSLQIITEKDFSREPSRWKNWWRQAREDFLTGDKKKEDLLKGLEIPLPKIPKRPKKTSKEPEKKPAEKAPEKAPEKKPEVKPEPKKDGK